MSSHEVTSIATMTGLLLVGLAVAAGLLQALEIRIRPIVETLMTGLVLSIGGWLERRGSGSSCVLVMALLSLVAGWRWISPESVRESAETPETPDCAVGGSQPVSEPGVARSQTDGPVP